LKKKKISPEKVTYVSLAPSHSIKDLSVKLAKWWQLVRIVTSLLHASFEKISND